MNHPNKLCSSSFVAIAVLALFTACNRDNTAAPPAPSTAPDNVTTPAPQATTPAPSTPAAPPAGTGDTTPAPGSSEPPTSAPPNSDTAPGNTGNTPAAPAQGSSLMDSSHANLARATPSTLRAAYGVDMTPVVDETAPDTTLGSSDENFLKDAAEGGIYEYEAAKIGSERARAPRVKAYAQMLATQHNAANEDLKRLADASHIAVPSQPPIMKRRVLDHLRKVDSNDFDQEFIKTVGINDHEDTIKRFEKATHETQDSNVREWAEKTLPTLREHLAEALTLATVVGSARK